MNKTIFWFFFLFVFSTSSQAIAYKVKNIAGKKILIDLENEKLFVGDTVLSIDKTINGPEILGSAQVLQVRSGQAVAKILEGRFIIGKKIARKKSAVPVIGSQSQVKMKNKVADLNEDLAYSGDQEINPDSEVNPFELKSISEGSVILRRDLVKVAFLISSTYDQIKTKQTYDIPPFTDTENVNMSGQGNGFGVSLDYPTRWGLTLRGTLMSEKVSVSGRAQFNSCNNRTSTNCYANIDYLNLGGLARFDYHVKKTNFWGAVGSVFKFPTSRDTTSLRKSDLQLANALVLSGGIDYSLNNKFYLPVSFEYHYSLNQSETVPLISHMSALLGFGIKF